MNSKINIKRIENYAIQNDGSCIVYKTRSGKIGLCRESEEKPKDTIEWDYFFCDEKENFPIERFIK